jgi:tetratricopeptide (TPR) repeat protein
MKKSALLLFLILFSLAAFAQKPKPTKKTASFSKMTAVNTGNEKDEFAKAVGQKDAAERINALRKFAVNFPKSNEKTRALELIVSARAEIADEKLRLSDTASGVELFTLAVRDAPTPVSDKLFTEILLQIPANLFARSQQKAAIEVARLIEQKVKGNANQILGLATFYLGTENSAEARRLAEKAIAINPNLPAAYQTLGLASRVNFQLEEAANAYAKALELDTSSAVSKRSLAEMKRATGKTDEAVALYREILAKNESDAAAQTGLALSLFDTDKRAEAEAEMEKSLAQNPNNLPMLVGAAYWYAAREDGAKAVELAQRAIAVEPRYTWAYIALARGFVLQKRPLEAEKALLTAKQYGNFPTLDYEIASVRLAAGFYREAADELRKSFALKEGLLQTRLGGRVPVEAKNFIELLALERRASIFEPLAADSSENADRIKSLLDFSQKLESAEASESAVAEAADEFVKGDDKMKVHRQIFVANQLSENKRALPKVLQLTRAAVSGVDSALDAANPSAAILADQLYESRRLAMIRGQLIIVPEVPRQTLLSILRGRIEEISGRTLYQQGKTSEAVVRLKRAVSVLPEKSAWWRASLWQLGTALEADGKSREALDAYIKSYISSEPDATKRIVIESAYQKINGSLEGLDQKIGAKSVAASVEPTAQPEQTASVSEKSVKEIPASQISSTPESKATPEVSTRLKTMTEPAPTPAAEKAEPSVAKKKSLPEPKMENTSAVLPTTKPNTEKKQTVVKQNPETKLLFDPIVIIVPNSETTKSKDENVGKENETKDKSLEKKNDSDADKSPVVTEKSSGSQERQIAQCKIIASQENISLLRGGGNLGILVGFEEAGDLKDITASSSSPKNIEVTLEPEIGGQSGRAFFVIKSISSKKGVFTITFDAPCGKKNVLVNVR